VCVFVEKRKITRKCLFRFFFSCFYAHSLIFSVSGPFGLFPFLVPFWMKHVDSFIFANSSFLCVGMDVVGDSYTYLIIPSFYFVLSKGFVPR
jgi:hypothetical protein